jgi:aminoglycoside phosphotransferase (APT) family kinase protein
VERWTTVKRLHQEALEREASQRAAFLDEACAGDEALRREVQSLLAYELEAATFLESPAVEVTAQSVTQTHSIPLSGRTLSHYQVQSLLGTGGMGEVYLARDPRLERAVALKILPPDLASDADRMQRFVWEAKAASALNHPNVATIHDVGESDGVRFIVMEYVEGQTFAEKIASGQLAAAEIVDVAVQVADALDAAHAKPRRPPRSIIRTSPQSTTSARATACASSSWNASRATRSRRRWRTERCPLRKLSTSPSSLPTR